MVSLLHWKIIVKLDSATIFFKTKGKVKSFCDKNESIYHQYTHSKENSKASIEGWRMKKMINM